MKNQTIIKFFGMILGLFLTVSVTAVMQINAEEKQASKTQQTETAGLPAETNSEVIGSGTCGDNLTWKLTNDGTLTISGSGTMIDYNEDSNRVPWFSLRDKITNVIINDGVESIGWDAFYRASNSEEAQSDRATGMGSSPRLAA